MAQSFSNPEPADNAVFDNDNKPTVLRLQITDSTVVDTTASRFNVNGTWYSETPYAIDTWSSPDRAGKTLSGLNPNELRYPVLEDNTEYTWYFEITETGGGGTFTSPEYTFTIGGSPGKPTNPSPANEATGITLDETPLSWDASNPAADTYEIYFREQGEDWELVGEAQAGVEWAIDFGTLGYNTTYEWRIDATNQYGTTTGDIWSFSCIAFDPPLPTGITLDADGNPTGTPTGENNMYTVKRLIAAANNAIWIGGV